MFFCSFCCCFGVFRSFESCLKKLLAAECFLCDNRITEQHDFDTLQCVLMVGGGLLCALGFSIDSMHVLVHLVLRLNCFQY